MKCYDVLRFANIIFNYIIKKVSMIDLWRMYDNLNAWLKLILAEIYKSYILQRLAL